MSGEIRRTPLGYQQTTVSTVAVAAVPATLNAASQLVIRCANANTRWRDDGTAPTAGAGVPLNAGETLIYDGIPSKLQFIRSGAADATLDIAAFGP